MTLQLDQRQRAMLLEMGIRVWLAEPPQADKPSLSTAQTISGKGTPNATTPSRTVSPQQPVRHAAAPAHDTHGFTITPPVSVYASDNLTPNPQAPVWLLFCEAPATSTVPAFMQTAAGRLLDNMLHAVQLRHSPNVHLALLSRQTSNDENTPTPPIADALSAIIDQLHPAIILLMGRRPAQLLLQRHEPLGQLRARVHSIRQTPAVVTYDPSGLLRAPADKARAWADLCLALQTCTPPPAAG